MSNRESTREAGAIPRSVAAVYRDDPRLKALIGPGAPFEVEDVIVDGVELRDFVRSPRTILDAFEMGRAHEVLVHLVYGNERVTFGEVRRRSLGLARSLREVCGVGRGDRVAIAMRNLPEFIVSFWGAALNGAVVVPLNGWWTAPELRYALEDAGAATLPRKSRPWKSWPSKSSRMQSRSRAMQSLGSGRTTP